MGEQLMRDLIDKLESFGSDLDWDTAKETVSRVLGKEGLSAVQGKDGFLTFSDNVGERKGYVTLMSLAVEDDGGTQIALQMGVATHVKHPLLLEGNTGATPSNLATFGIAAKALSEEFDMEIDERLIFLSPKE